LLQEIAHPMAAEEQAGRRVLIVDASTYYSRLLAGWSLEHGYSDVGYVSDTRSAWSQLLLEKFDLIVIDRDCGPDDGLELTRLLRLARDNPNCFTPIVLMASVSTQSLVESARDCGINEFLAKPVSKKSFTERLTVIEQKPRNFIKAGVFFGPDRRRRRDERSGDDRRKGRAERVTKDDEKLRT
jgi:DNA-binding response OmpR family regulator